jgi:surface polysaccharide O-acyltransferase-like enzyme
MTNMMRTHARGLTGVFVAGAIAFSLLTVAWAPIDRALRWLLLPLSQHALSAYTSHLFVTALIMRMKPAIVGTAPATAAQNTLLQVVAIALMWAIIMLKPTALRQFHASVSRVKNLRGITREHLSLPAHFRDR